VRKLRVESLEELYVGHHVITAQSFPERSLVFRIRIRIDFGRLNPDPDPHWESGSGYRSRRANNLRNLMF
jgi:hypothetical protein